MKITPDCIPCLLTRCLFEANLVAPERASAIMKEALTVIGREYAPDRCSAVVGTKLHGAIVAALGRADIYSDLKVASNRIAQGLYPRAAAYVETAEDRLRAAVLCSIIGNVLDFGIAGTEAAVAPEAFISQFETLIDEGLGVAHMAAFERLTGPGARVLYFTDNCGEIVFDRLLIEELKARGASVELVVKGVPVLSDATRADVDALGLDTVVDAVLDCGPYAVGLDLEAVPAPLAEALETATLVIAKGMANFEAISESPSRFRPIAYLMRTKCDAVAAALGVDRGQNICFVETESGA